MKILEDGPVKSEFHYDEMEDKSHVRQVQDVEPILEANKTAQTLNDGYSPSRDLKRIASIPLVIAQQWMKEDGINWMSLPKDEKAKYLRKKLNDPEYRFLRTSGGVF